MTTPETAAPADPARPTPPWVFLFLDLPFGAAVGYLSITVPFWMERRGFELAAIALVSGGANLAHAFKLVWIPLLDLGSFRKVWYLAMAVVTASLFVAMALLPDPLGNLKLFGALLTALQASATTGHAANNALMATTTRFADKGKVGGFAMASNVGSTGLLGAAAILLAQWASPRAAALAMAGIVLASASLALRIVEPHHVDAAVARAGTLARAARLHVVAMLKDLWATVRSREGFTGLVICLAPVGCQAMSNLFTGVAGPYGASAELVSLANGVGGGVGSALGALVGGVLADRMSRRVAYALSGGLTAVCAVAMAAAPMTPARPAAAVALLLAFPARLKMNPFSIPNAEQEIVAGPLTEYNGWPLALFELAHGLELVALSGLFAAMFFPHAAAGWLRAAIYLGGSLLVVVVVTLVAAATARLKVRQAFRFYSVWGGLAGLIALSASAAW